MSNDLRTADPLSHLGYNNRTDSKVNPSLPPLEHKSSDNLLDYYQSEDAGRTYYQSMPKSPPSRMHSISSSSSSYSQTPDSANTDPPLSSVEDISRRLGQNSLDDRQKKSKPILPLSDVHSAKLNNFHSDKSAGIMARRGLDGSRLDPIALLGASDKISRSLELSCAPVSANRSHGPERVPNSHGHQRSHSEVHVVDAKDYKSRSNTASHDAVISDTVLTFDSFHAMPSAASVAASKSQSIHRGNDPASNSRFLLLSSSSASNDVEDDPQVSKPIQSFSVQHLTPSKRDVKATVPDDHDLPSHLEPLTHSTFSPVEQHYAQVIQVSDPQYLNYVAGIHAMAGPLPSPPRNIIPPVSSPPPKRPPRLQSPPPSRSKLDSPITQVMDSSASHSHQNSKSSSPTPSLQQPDGQPQQSSPLKVSLDLVASRNHLYTSPSATLKPRHRDPEPPLNLTEPSRRKHVREGAQSNDVDEGAGNLARGSETMGDLVAAVGKAIDNFNVEPETHILPNERSSSKTDQSEAPVMRRATSWISQSSLSSAHTTSVSGSKKLAEFGSGDVIYAESNVAHPARRSQEVQRESFGSSKEFRRSSSFLSSSHSLSHPLSSGTRHAANPSSSSQHLRAISAWPQAMQYTDVISLRTSLERTAAYARKINELATRDCGLHDWLMQRKHAKGSHRDATLGLGSRRSQQSSIGPVGSATQPRVVSHGSVASEATFPLRADAYVATDLAQRYNGEDDTPTSPTSSLPYPSLARLSSQSSQSSPYRPSGGSLSTPTTPKSPGGFFASIGRKASVKRAPTLPTLSAGKLIATRSPTLPGQIRPTKLGTTSIPGGPRSPMGATRSPSLLGQSRNALATIVQEDSQPVPLTARSPSLPLTSRAQPPAAPPSNAAFTQQVNKLADVLPHVDRQVLEGYLRRAGQDMLAIGQYLEDEKKGTVRLDV